MVKTTGPLLSQQASGTLADTLTFSKWKGKNYVRRRVIPSNPQTPSQSGRRAMFSWLTKQWANINTPHKATWQNLADQLTTSPFHAYISFNQEAWHNFLPPSKKHPAPRENDAGQTDGFSTAVWEGDRIKLTIWMDVLNDAHGIVLFASQTTGFTPNIESSILIERFDEFHEFIYYWRPPATGTWYFRNRPFSDDGKWGIFEVEFSAVP